MPEEPEQVLPEQRPAVGRVEGVRAEPPVGLQAEQRGRQHREGEEHQNGGEQDVPDEDRHPEHRHPGCAEADDRGDEVDRAEDGAEAGEGQAHDPQVRADAGAVLGAVERRVGEPAEVGRAVRGEEAEDGDQRAEQVEPVGERVQPGEGDVGGAELQRHDPVGEPGEQRGREHQQHDRAVHGEELVELLVGEELQPGAGQLDPHQHRHQPADQEEREGGGEVEGADPFVVGGGQPADQGPAAPAAGGGAAPFQPRGARTAWGLLHEVLRQKRHVPRLPGPGQGSDQQYRSARRGGRGRAGRVTRTGAVGLPGGGRGRTVEVRTSLRTPVRGACRAPASGPGGIHEQQHVVHASRPAPALALGHGPTAADVARRVPRLGARLRGVRGCPDADQRHHGGPAGHHGGPRRRGLPDHRPLRLPVRPHRLGLDPHRRRRAGGAGRRVPPHGRHLGPLRRYRAHRGERRRELPGDAVLPGLVHRGDRAGRLHHLGVVHPQARRRRALIPPTLVVRTPPGSGPPRVTPVPAG